MTAKPKQQAAPLDAERFRIKLARKLDRLVAEVIDGWRTCDKAKCRRAKRCVSAGRECIAKWQKSRPPLSPEQAEAGMEDFRITMIARKRLGGDSCTAEQLTEAIREEKARRAAIWLPDDPLVPVAEETQLAPEKQARIDRAWNDTVASLPAEDVETEDADERKRERRPRITQL